MRRNVFLCMIVLFVLLGGFASYGEHQQEEKKEREVLSNEISIRAPNGEMIAPTFKALYDEIAKVIEKQFGQKKSFMLRWLDYVEYDCAGYFVFVEYVTEEGNRGNYVKTNCSLKKCHQAFYITEYGESDDTTIIWSTPGKDCPKEHCLLTVKDNYVYNYCEKCELKNMAFKSINHSDDGESL